jgi:translocation and assembly module TamB
MIKRILYILLAFILLIIFSVLFLSVTDPGLKVAFAITSKFVPGTLKADEISGRLINKIEISQLEYNNKDIHIYIKDFKLHYLPLKLLYGRIDIKKLYINTANIHLPKAQPVKQKKENKDTVDLTKYFGANSINIPKITFPMQLSLDDVSLHDVSLQSGKAAATNIKDVKLIAHTSGHSIEIKKCSFAAKPYRAQLQGTIQLQEPFKVQLDGLFNVDYVGYAPIISQLTINGDLQHKLTLNYTVAKPFNAKLNATFEKAELYGPVNIQGQWSDVLVPVNKSLNILSKAGKIAITGKLNNYKINFASDIGGLNIPTGKWKIFGQGNFNSIQLNHISATILGGTLNAKISLGWLPYLNWQAQIKGQKINPGLEWRDWEGNINFAAYTDGKLNSNNPEFTVKLIQLSGKLHKHTLRGYIDCQMKNNDLHIAKSHLNIGDEVFKIQGQLTNNWNMQWKLYSPTLTELLPSATGSIHSQGTIFGARKIPTIKGNINVDNLAMTNLSVKKLALNANIQTKPHADSLITLFSNNIIFKKKEIKQAQLKLKGFIGHQKLYTLLKTPNEQYVLSAAGTYLNKVWQGSINRFNLTSRKFNNWQLKSPIQLNISQDKIKILPFTWYANNANLQGQIDWQKNQASSLQLSAKNLPLAIFDDLLAEPIQINSKINLDASLQRTAQGATTGNIDLQSMPGSITYKKKKIPLTSSHLKTTIDKAGLNTNLILDESGSPSTITLNLPDYDGTSLPQKLQKLNGKININLKRLDLLPALIPQIENTSGKLSANFDVGGTIAQPTLDGSLALTNGQARIPDVGLNISGIQLKANAKKSGNVTFNCQAKSDKGILKIDGNTSITQGFFPTQLTIKGQNILAIDHDGYKAYISPDLKLTYQQPKLSLTGTLSIPQALISPQDFTTVTTLPSNVIILKDDQTKAEPLFDLYANIIIKVGNNVAIDYAGLYAKLGGELRINLAPMQLTTASGSLKITEGKYDAYGQKLKISKGVLTYTGGTIDNPGLNIRASKTIKHAVMPSTSEHGDPTQRISLITDTRDITVGLAISGTLQEPKLKLFSEPIALTDSNILSYLVLGVASNQASGAQTQLLLTAAQSFGADSNNITDSIQKTFGLTEFGLETETYVDADNTTQQGTAFAIGKYITPKIYLHYSIGVGSDLRILYLRYLFTKAFYLQTESTTRGTGVDIFYSFQTN